jgi:serine/threonine protein kinase
VFGKLTVKEKMLLHRGRFSDVYFLKEEQLIIKIFNPKKKYSQLEKKRFKNEFYLWQLNYPDILPEIQEENGLILIRKAIPGTPLSKKQNLLLQEKEKYLLQIARQIQAVHDAGFLHLDIKPSNILINDKGAFLIDFASALERQKRQIPRNYVMPFTMIYAPQECVLNRFDLADTSTDWFMWGMTAYELFTGATPVYHKNPALLMHLQINFRPQIHLIPSHWKKVLQKALSQYHFPKPPHYYSSHETAKMITEGKQNRIRNLQDLMEQLKQGGED